MSEAPSLRASAATPGRRHYPDYWHYLCHRVLLRLLDDVLRQPGRVAALDVVAVPASRRPHNLVHAARAARRADSHLLVLCSGRAGVAWAYRIARVFVPADRLTIAFVPAGTCLPGLELKADRSPLVRDRDSDTSLKRNLAIAVARMCGWQRLLFLDDDVRGVGPAQLAVLTDALADRPGAPTAVAWAFEQFPDNSVVCHANRRIGAAQSTFVGGGALAVRVDQAVPHFPLMYNEDWLFLLPLLWQRPSGVVMAGCLRQKRFNPYRDPQDAPRQETGDLIGEMLFGLVHREEPVTVAATHHFWRRALAQREAFVRHVKRELESRLGRRSARARKALDRVLEMDHGGRDRPRLLSGWVRAWRSDLVAWSAWLNALEPASSAAEALGRLGVDVHDARGRRRREPAEAGTRGAGSRTPHPGQEIAGALAPAVDEVSPTCAEEPRTDLVVTGS